MLSRPLFHGIEKGAEQVKPCSSVIGFDLDPADAVVNEVELFGRSFREIDDPVFDIGAPVVDLHKDHFSVSEIGYPDDGAEWQRAMRGSELLQVELLAARGLPAMEVVGVIGCLSDGDQKLVSTRKVFCGCVLFSRTMMAVFFVQE